VLEDQSHMPVANKNAIIGICKFFAAVILIGGVVYSEILFLGIVSNLFPTGPMAIGAMLGAITTGASILLLVLAKSHWFRPGNQLMVAWIFTAVEITVLILNDILAYQIHQGGQLDQYMASWRLFCVAAPVVSVVGWILLFYFDPQRSITHRRMEMEDNVAKSQIDFQSRMHMRTMALRIKAADMALAKFEEKVEHKLEYQLDVAAAKYSARVASELTGEHVSHTDLLGPASSAPQISSPKVVESNPPASPAKAASKDQVVDPHQVKPSVDKEVKPLEKKKSFGQLLGSAHAAFHGAVDNALDKKTIPVEKSDYSPEFEEELEKEIAQPVQPKVTTVFVSPAEEEEENENPQ
jgi:hypothetical protein